MSTVLHQHEMPLVLIYRSQCQQYGFQRIVPSIDLMAAKCYYTTTIVADKRYTNIITNGNQARLIGDPACVCLITINTTSRTPRALFAALHQRDRPFCDPHDDVSHLPCVFSQAIWRPATSSRTPVCLSIATLSPSRRVRSVLLSRRLSVAGVRCHVHLSRRYLATLRIVPLLDVRNVLIRCLFTTGASSLVQQD